MTHAIEYMRLHWPAIIAIGGPALMTLVSTLVSTFQDPDHNPETPPPTWVRVLIFFQKWSTGVAPKGTIGMMGTRFSMPYLHYPETQKGLPLPPPSPTPAPPAALLPFLLVSTLAIPSCYCSLPQHKDEPRCVVQQQVIDCSTTAVSKLAPLVVPQVKQWLAGQFDYIELLKLLGQFGVHEVMCIIDAVRKDFLSAASDKDNAIGTKLNQLERDVLKQKSKTGMRYKTTWTPSTPSK